MKKRTSRPQGREREERRAEGGRSGGGKAAGRKGGIKMKESMQRPVALQTKVRKQNTVMYGEERKSEKGN